MSSSRPVMASALVLVFFTLAGVGAQTVNQPANPADPAAYIGMGLNELLSRFGPPRSVYAVRGIEEWQDDVVFVYDGVEFYLLKDRVWQLGLKSAYRVSSGDPGSAAYLSFGNAVYSGRDFAVFPLGGYSWPLALRCNFDPGGKVAAIFIYRPDV